MACSINKGVAFNCLRPQQGGIESYVIGINFEDWRASTVVVDSTTRELESITLAGAATGYKFEVSKSSNLVATNTPRAVDGVDGFDHGLTMRLNTIEQVDIDNLSKLRYTKTVWIVPQLEGRAKIYGGGVTATGTPVGVGMRGTVESNDGDAGTGGTVMVTLKTPDSDPPELEAPRLIEAAFDISTLLPT